MESWNTRSGTSPAAEYKIGHMDAIVLCWRCKTIRQGNGLDSHMSQTAKPLGTRLDLKLICHHSGRTYSSCNLWKDLEIELEITFIDSNWHVSVLTYTGYSSKNGLTSRPSDVCKRGEQQPR